MNTLKLLLTSTLLFSAATSLPAGALNWKAQWIGAPWDTEELDRSLVLPAPEFMKEITVSKRISNATAYVTGLGFFEFFVNGEKVGDEVLSPNETSYGHRAGLPGYGISMDDTNWKEFRVPYLTYDITKMLEKGGNKFSALVGNGFYSTCSEGWTEPYGTPRFICQIEIKYNDGSEETIVSGPDWKVRRSPIVLNDMYRGEIYDARLEDSDKWEQAAQRKAPDGALYPQDGPADRVIETIKPQSITKLEDGNWEVKFGDYVTGWVRLNGICAPKGTEIEIEFPIETKGNGTYKYISSGEPAATYAPRFTWWAFDTAIVKGWPGDLKPENILAEVVHSDVPVCMEFDCSNPLLKQINDIWRRTQTDNMHLGVATDCPHREKGPYTGDGEVSCVAVMHNFASDQFYRKWLRDMIGCQDTETGYVPNGAPWHPGCGGGVPWGSAMCIIPWEHYVHFGDISVLEESYEAMKGYIEWMKKWRLEDGTMLQQMTSHGEIMYWFNLGEWCPPFGLPSENLIHTWYLWRCATFTANAAKALGIEAEYAEYQLLADEIAACFHSKFYHPETGSYSDGSGITSDSGYGTGNGKGAGDGSNIFALAMGVPADRHDAVVATVKKEFEANGGHLNTGIYGTSLFFEILCREGLAEEAYTAMTKREFPSFGWWLEQGATTTWEEWNGNSSHNHPMFGGGLVWMYRWIAGVQTDDAEPGYKHIILRPTPVGDLTWATYKTETAYGNLSVRWDLKDGGRFRLKTRIPRGARATVYLPDGSDPVEIQSGKKTLRCKI